MSQGLRVVEGVNVALNGMLAWVARARRCLFRC
jgi:hypothetical protein